MTVFRNRMAWVPWIFMAIWMSFLIAMTWVVVRDGPPGGHSWTTMGTVLAFFWLGGTGATAWACRVRLLRVDVGDSGALDVTWRTPFHVERRRVEAVDVPPAVVVDGKDSDGDAYYTCRVTLADGATIDLAEGHNRSRIEADAARFNAVAGRRRGAGRAPAIPTSP